MINKSKTRIIVAIVIFCIIVSACIIMIPHKMTSEKRLTDFEYACDTIEASLHQLNDYEQLYNINYDELKAEYTELISSCENDAEFYYLMKSFLNAIPSVHTALIFPDKNAYSQSGGYNSAQQTKSFGVQKQAEHFSSVLAEDACKYSDAKYYLANYIDGKYYFLSDETATIIEIDSINGQDPDLFITDIQSIFKIGYDHINSKPFYSAVVFNDKYGDKAAICGHYTDGTKVETVLYYSLFASDTISWTANDFENKKIKSVNAAPTDPYNLHIDKENDISYISISSFSAAAAEELKEKVSLAAQCKNVIIDLRGNTGGVSRTEINSLFVPLLTDNISFENTFKFDVNESTEHITPKIADSDSIITETIEITGNIGVFSEKYNVIGESETEHNLFVLIDYNTISAGDEAASFVKLYRLGTLIGNNTAGEGRTGSYLTAVLPNSRLVFNYSFGYNSIDDKDNSVYGTAPDIYVQNGIDEYIKKLSRENSLSFNNRREWDNVLIETLELINEKENAK